MAHELRVEDGEAAMLYDGAEPWQGLGALVDYGAVPAFTAGPFPRTDGFQGYENVYLSLESMSRFAERMLATADRFDFVKWILDVREDVLGLYTVPGEHPHARVDLYWGVIGLVAGMLAVSVEDLTAVVLAHECAHAYTHLGSDMTAISGPRRASRTARDA